MLLNDIYQTVIVKDDVETLKQLKYTINDATATNIVSISLLVYTWSIKCIMYLLNNYKIEGNQIKSYHISPLLYKGRKFKQRMNIFIKIIKLGYKIDDIDLHNAVIKGANISILLYIFSLPEENWISTDNFCIPFLIHHIIRSDKPGFFIYLFKKYISKRDPMMISRKLNLKYYLCNLYPLQTLSTDYKCIYSKVEPIPFQNMILSFHVTKMLIDHGADPYHDPCILKDQEKLNPQLANFMKSYSQQKVAHQVIHNLLKIEKKIDIMLPFQVIIHIGTSHMEKENPYVKKFINKLYMRYYSTTPCKE